MSTRIIEKGFSLFEMAIVLFILGAVIVGVALPMLARTKIHADNVLIQKIKDSNLTLEEMKQTLLGYAALNQTLPCPDTDSDGLENRQASPSAYLCSSTDGFIPWKTLGLIKGLDVWGNTIRYRVDQNYASYDLINPISTNNKQISSSNHAVNTALRIKTFDWLNDQTNTIDYWLADSSSIIAVLFSIGKNGQPDYPNNTATTVGFYVQDTRNFYQVGDLNAHFNTFDDVVTWISKFQVINALNNAGKWK
jgi:hypothetical protein